MAITIGTLAQEVDGKVEYIYPKTIAEAVEYNPEESVKERIENINKDISEVNARITTIASGIDYGSLGNKNDAELFDIRTPSYNVVAEGTTYTSAGEAIRGQLEILIELIGSIEERVKKLEDTINN